MGLGLASSTLGAACSDESEADAPSNGTGAAGGDSIACPGGVCPSGTGGSVGQAGAGAGPTEPACPDVEPTTPLDVELAGEEAGGAVVSVHFNHLGYELGGPKRVVVESSAPLSRFQVVSTPEQDVYVDGQLDDAGSFTAWSGAPHHYVADFSELTRAGDYVLRINGQSSPSFAVEERLLASQEYQGLTFSVDYQDQDEDGYMETVLLFVGTPVGSHCVTFMDNDQDDSPDFVICTNTPPGLFTTDLDGDGRFDLYNDAETEELRIVAEDSLVEVESVEGLGRDGVSSSTVPKAISVKDGTTYVFADGIWARQD